MTYPWAAGEVLTAADLNAYAGLVHVSTTTIGTAVSSVTVSNVFSSTFDNYRIVWRVDSASASTGTEMQLGSATSNYKYAFRAFRWDNTTFSFFSAAASDFYVGATFAATGAGAGSIDLYGPNLAKPTHYTCLSNYGASADGWTGHGAGVQTDSTPFTGFTLTPGGGTYTGGTIRVYGYNNG